MNRLGIGRYHTMHPAHWDECSPAQVRKLSQLVLSEEYRNWVAGCKSESTDVRESNAEWYRLRLLAFHIVLDSWRKPRLLWLMQTKLTATHYVEYLNHPDKPVDWVFKAGLTKQMFPTLRPSLFGPTFHGPQDEFRNMTVYEFLSCAERYKAYTKTHSLRWAEEMIELLWRPLGPALIKDGVEQKPERADIRTYDRSSHKGWAAMLTEGQRLSVIIWWQGCLHLMSGRYKLLFEDGGGRAADPMEVILRLAGSPKEKDVDEAATARIVNVMADMNRKIREDRELAAKRKHPH